MLFYHRITIKQQGFIFKITLAFSITPTPADPKSAGSNNLAQVIYPIIHWVTGQPAVAVGRKSSPSISDFGLDFKGEVGIWRKGAGE